MVAYRASKGPEVIVCRSRSQVRQLHHLEQAINDHGLAALMVREKVLLVAPTREALWSDEAEQLLRSAMIAEDIRLVGLANG
jgi:hypothetical protein